MQLMGPDMAQSVASSDHVPVTAAPGTFYSRMSDYDVRMGYQNKLVQCRLFTTISAG